MQEQSGNDETDMQMMRAHTDTLLDTLRDIAQVKKSYTHLHVHIYHYDASFLF